MANAGELSVEVKARIDDFSDKLNRCTSKATDFAKKMTKIGGKDYFGPTQERLQAVSKDLRNIVQGIILSQAFYQGLSLFNQLTSAVYKYTDALDYAKITFGNLFRDASLGEEFVAVLQQYAARSPFDFTDVEKGARQLAAYGIQAKNLMYVMQGIGNLSAVTGDPQTFDTVSRAIGQIYSKGKLSAEEMRQLAEAGLNVKDVYDRLGVSAGNVAKSNIDAATAINAIVDTLNESYEGAMDAANMTMRGMIGNIKDVLLSVASAVYTPAYKTMQRVLLGFQQAIDRFQKTFTNNSLAAAISEAFGPDVLYRIQQTVAIMQQLGNLVYQLLVPALKIAAMYGKSVATAFMMIMQVVGPTVQFFAGLLNALLSTEQGVRFLQNAILGLVVFKMVSGFGTMLITALQGIARMFLPIVQGAVGAAKGVLLFGRALSAGAGASAAASTGWASFVGTLAKGANPILAIISLVIALISALAGLRAMLGMSSDALAGFGEQMDFTKYFEDVQMGSGDIEKFNNALEDTSDDIDDVNGALGDTAKAQEGLLSFDEVFKLPEKSDGSGGGDGGLGDLGDVWPGGGGSIPDFGLEALDWHDLLPDLTSFFQDLLDKLKNLPWMDVARVVSKGLASGLKAVKDKLSESVPKGIKALIKDMEEALAKELDKFKIKEKVENLAKEAAEGKATWKRAGKDLVESLTKELEEGLGAKAFKDLKVADRLKEITKDIVKAKGEWTTEARKALQEFTEDINKEYLKQIRKSQKLFADEDWLKYLRELVEKEGVKVESAGKKFVGHYAAGLDATAIKTINDNVEEAVEAASKRLDKLTKRMETVLFKRLGKWKLSSVLDPINADAQSFIKDMKLNAAEITKIKKQLEDLQVFEGSNWKLSDTFEDIRKSASKLASKIPSDADKIAKAFETLDKDFVQIIRSWDFPKIVDDLTKSTEKLSKLNWVAIEKGEYEVSARINKQMAQLLEDSLSSLSKSIERSLGPNGKILMNLVDFEGYFRRWFAELQATVITGDEALIREVNGRFDKEFPGIIKKAQKTFKSSVTRATNRTKSFVKSEVETLYKGTVAAFEAYGAKLPAELNLEATFKEIGDDITKYALETSETAQRKILANVRAKVFKLSSALDKQISEIGPVVQKSLNDILNTNIRKAIEDLDIKSVSVKEQVQTLYDDIVREFGTQGKTLAERIKLREKLTDIVEKAFSESSTEWQSSGRKAIQDLTKELNSELSKAMAGLDVSTRLQYLAKEFEKAGAEEFKVAGRTLVDGWAESVEDALKTVKLDTSGISIKSFGIKFDGELISSKEIEASLNKSFGQAVKDVFANVGEWFKEVPGRIAAAVSEAFVTAKALVRGDLTFSDVFEIISDSIKNSNAANVFESFKLKIAQIFTKENIKAFLKTSIKDMGITVIGEMLFDELANWLDENGVHSAAAALSKLGPIIASGLGTAIATKSPWGFVVGAIWGSFFEAIEEGIDTLDFSSLATNIMGVLGKLAPKLMGLLGKEAPKLLGKIGSGPLGWGGIIVDIIFGGITSALEANGNEYAATVVGEVGNVLGGALTGAAIGLIGGPWGALAGAIIGAIVSELAAHFPEITSWWDNVAWPFIKGIPDAIVGFFTNAWQWLNDPDKNPLYGLWLGIQEVWKGISEFFTGIYATIVGFFTNDHELLYDSGFLIMDGLANGLKGAWDIVWGVITGLPKLIIGIFIGAGSWLLEHGHEIIEGLLAGIQGAWEAVSKFFADMPGNISAFFAGVGSWLFEAGKSLLTGLAEGILAAKQGIDDFFTNLPGNIGAFFGGVAAWLVTDGWEMLTGLLKGIGDAAGAVFDFFIDLPGKILGFLVDAGLWLLEAGANVIIGFIDGLGNAIVGVFDFFINLPIRILEFFTNAIDWLFGSGEDTMQGMEEGQEAGFSGGITDFFTHLPERILGFFVDAVAWLFKSGVSILTGILNGMGEAWPKIQKWLKDLPKNIDNFFKDAKNWLLERGKHIYEGMFNGLKNIRAKVDKWWKALPDDTKKFFSDAPKWLLDKGKQILDGMFNGIKNAYQNVVTWYKNLPTNIKNFFSNAANWLVNAGKNILNGLKSGITTAWTNIQTWFRNLPSNVQGFFSNAGNWLINAGKNIINGFLNGLKSAFTNVQNFISGIGDWIVNNKGPENYDKQLLVPAGENIMEGFQDGLEGGYSDVQDFVGGIGSDIQSNFSDSSSWLTDSGKQIIDGLRSGAISRRDGVMSLFEEMPEDISSQFINADGTLTGRGEELISGLENGTSDNFKDFLSIVKRMPSEIDSSFDTTGVLTDHGKEVIENFKISAESLSQTKIPELISNVQDLLVNGDWDGPELLTEEGKRVAQSYTDGINFQSTNTIPKAIADIQQMLIDGEWDGPELLTPEGKAVAQGYLDSIETESYTNSDGTVKDLMDNLKNGNWDKDALSEEGASIAEGFHEGADEESEKNADGVVQRIQDRIKNAKWEKEQLLESEGSDTADGFNTSMDNKFNSDTPTLASRIQQRIKDCMERGSDSLISPAGDKTTTGFTSAMESTFSSFEGNTLSKYQSRIKAKMEPGSDTLLTKSGDNYISGLSSHIKQKFDSFQTTYIDKIQGRIKTSIQTNSDTTLNTSGTNYVKGLSSKIKEKFDNFHSDYISKIQGRIKDKLQSGSDTLLNTAGNNIIQGLGSKIKEKFNDLNNNTIATYKGKIKDKFNGSDTLLQASGTALMKGLKSGATSKWSEVHSWISGLRNNISGIFSNASNWLWQAGSSIINGFLNGMKNAFNNVKDFIWGIGDWIVRNKGPETYDKQLLIPAGNWIIEGLESGLTSRFQDALRTVRSFGPQMEMAFNAPTLSASRMSVPTITQAPAVQYEAVPAPISTQSAQQTETVANPYLNTETTTPEDSQRPIMYVGTLIADKQGLRELQRKLDVVKAEQGRYKR